MSEPDAEGDGDKFRCGSCGETRWAGSVSWWTDCENCGASDWQRAATDGGQPDGEIDREEPETAYCPDCGQVVEIDGHFSGGSA